MENKKETPNQELLKLLNSRLKLAQSFGKTWRKDFKTWLKDYEIDTPLNDPELHNRLQVPYIFSTIESGLPTIFESMPQLIMKKRGKRDEAFTVFTTGVWDYVKSITKLEEKVDNVGMNFLIGGIANMRYGWKLKTKQVDVPSQQPLINPTGEPVLDEMGEPVVQEIIDKQEVTVVSQPVLEHFAYDKIHFSPESKFTIDDNENLIPYLFVEKQMTPDAIEEVYGVKTEESDVKTLDVENIDSELKNTDIDKNFDKTDMGRVPVYIYYGQLPKKLVKGEWTSDSVYQIAFIGSKTLETASEIEKKPFNLIGNYGTPDKFWKFGEPKTLRALEQDISLGRSTIMDYRDRYGTKLAIPSGVELDEVKMKDPKSFCVVKFAGNTFPQYISPPALPEVVMTALEQSRTDLQMVSATLDISRGGDSNTVNTATGQKIFAQASEKRLARKRQKIGNFIKALAKNILVMCANNWEIDKFVEITDLEPQEIMEGQYIEKLQKLGLEYDIDIDVESMSSNKDVKKAQAIALYDKMKDSPYVNQTELIKTTIEVGFEEKDVDRYLNMELTPDQLIQALKQFMQAGFIPQEIALEMEATIMQSAQNPGAVNPEGRPEGTNPVATVEKNMTGSDEMQIDAQGSSAKQNGQTRPGYGQGA